MSSADRIAGRETASVTVRSRAQMPAPLSAAASSSAGSIVRKAAPMMRKTIG